MDRIFMILKKVTSGVHLPLPWCYIHIYDHNSQTRLLVYRPDFSYFINCFYDNIFNRSEKSMLKMYEWIQLYTCNTMYAYSHF